MHGKIFPIAAFLLLLAACVTTTESGPPGTDGAVVRSAPAERAWIVVFEGREVGSVIRFQESEDQFLYTVRNEHQQDMGMIDVQGRAFRFRPYNDPEWLGTGTVGDGARKVLGLGPDAEVREVQLTALASEDESSAPVPSEPPPPESQSVEPETVAPETVAPETAESEPDESETDDDEPLEG